MLRAFADLGFRWKIALPILLLVVLLVLMGGLGMQGVSQVADSSKQLTNRYLPAISLLLNADRDLYQAFTAERSLLDEGQVRISSSSRPTMRRTCSRPMTACTSTQRWARAPRRGSWWPSSTAASSSGRSPP